MDKQQMPNNKLQQIQPPRQSFVSDVTCRLVRLELADGYQSSARLFEATHAKQAIVYLHGIQSHSGWFVRSCDYLQRQGHTILAPDRRGSGLNQRERGHCDNCDQLIEDLDRCVNWLMKHSGKKQIDIVAVSWSGKWALVYAAKFPDKVRSIALVGPGLCAKVDISLREKIAVGVHGLLKPNKLHEIPLNDPNLFTQNPPMLEFIENDPLKITHCTASFMITSTRFDMKVSKIIAKLKVPIYLFLAQDDRIIANQATIDLLRPALTNQPNSQDPVRIYPNAQHTLDFEPDPLLFFQNLAELF